MATTTIVGSYLSPYVRKVLVCLAVKRVPYEIDPIVPFYGSDDFARISPVRRIPVLIDDAVTVSDSTVICEYLEDRYPTPALLPKAPAQRARARWLEEFADSRMGEVLIWHYFNQLVIRRFVWGEEPDAAVLDHDAFRALRPFEELLLRAPIAEHRTALQAAGAPVTATTFGTATPRRGILAI